MFKLAYSDKRVQKKGQGINWTLDIALSCECAGWLGLGIMNANVSVRFLRFLNPDEEESGAKAVISSVRSVLVGARICCGRQFIFSRFKWNSDPMFAVENCRKN